MAEKTDAKDDAMKAFVSVTQALWELTDDGDRERVLRATAVLLGYDFLEDARVRKRAV